MEIGKRIQVRRKKMGLTTEALGEMVGVTASRIQQFEAGILPANTNKGAIAKVKRILRVRNRGPKPRARTTRRREPSGLADAIKALRLEVASLSVAVGKLYKDLGATAPTVRTYDPESLAA